MASYYWVYKFSPNIGDYNSESHYVMLKLFWMGFIKSLQSAQISNIMHVYEFHALNWHLKLIESGTFLSLKMLLIELWWLLLYKEIDTINDDCMLESYMFNN